MNTSKVMDDVYEVIDEIRESAEYRYLKDAYDNLLSDKEGAKLIKDFDQAKAAYSLDPSNPLAIKNLSLKKKALYTFDLYKVYDKSLMVYNEKEKELEEKINDALFKENVKKIASYGCLKNDQKR